MEDGACSEKISRDRERLRGVEDLATVVRLNLWDSSLRVHAMSSRHIVTGCCCEPYWASCSAEWRMGIARMGL